MLTPSEHILFARRAMLKLVGNVLNFQGNRKWITYGELAAEISYPPPHLGNLFGSEIGRTLGFLGHMFDGIRIEGEKIPMLQALVVSSKTHLPSDGLREFDETYDKLSTAKKKDFVQCEYADIFNFGFKWVEVIKLLGIGEAEGDLLLPPRDHQFNPYGSEGSPEHVALRDWIIANPSFFSLPEGTIGIPEYPLKSGDKVDVVFTNGEQVVLGVEVKSTRSDVEDLRRGIFQCIKYSAVLTAEEVASERTNSITCLLIMEGILERNLHNIARLVGVKIIDNCRDSLDRR